MGGWGYAVYVLHYRLELAHQPQQMGRQVASSVEPAIQDGLQALIHIRQKAHEFRMDENRLGVLGFSAGGHLATCICRAIAEKEPNLLNEPISMPKAIILAYPSARNPCCPCIGGGVLPCT